MTKINSKLFPKKSSELAQHPCIYSYIKGCAANPDDANSDDLLGRTLKLIFVNFSNFDHIN